MKPVLAVALLLSSGISRAGDTADRDVMKHRRAAVWTANLGIPVGTHIYLFESWYSSFDKTKFRFVNDNHHWAQIDKVGHAFSGYFLAVNSAASFRWAGFSQKKSALLGSAISLGFQYTIEYFDGHSSGWGASPGDLAANTIGTLFGGIQSFCWGKVRIPMSITFQSVSYAAYRPELLGKNFLQHKLKDYNSQTYWLSFYPHQMGIRPDWWPKWLGISAGYGVKGFLGAESNIWTQNGDVHDYSNVTRSRQFYLSPGVALGHIPTKNKLVRILFKITDHWKLPLPAMEFNSPGKPVFHWLYW